MQIELLLYLWWARAVLRRMAAAGRWADSCWWRRWTRPAAGGRCALAAGCAAAGRCARAAGPPTGPAEAAVASRVVAGRRQTGTRCSRWSAAAAAVAGCSAAAGASAAAGSVAATSSARWWTSPVATGGAGRSRPEFLPPEKKIGNIFKGCFLIDKFVSENLRFFSGLKKRSLLATIKSTVGNN